MWNLVSDKESKLGESVREQQGVEPKREGITTPRENFNNEELYYLQSSPNTIWVVTSKRMR